MRKNTCESAGGWAGSKRARRRGSDYCGSDALETAALGVGAGVFKSGGVVLVFATAINGLSDDTETPSVPPEKPSM